MYLVIFVPFAVDTDRRELDNAEARQTSPGELDDQSGDVVDEYERELANHSRSGGSREDCIAEPNVASS